MIIVLKPQTTQDDLHRVENMVKARGLDTHVIEGSDMTIIGCIGDTSRIDPKLFEVDSSVTKVMHVQEPYKLASRAFHPEDSVIDVSGVKVGGDHLALIAGPCSVESTEQVLEIAKAAKASGANMLRGGAFKPRTSPYSFQGMGLEGLDILCEAKAATGLPIVTELMSAEYLDIFNEKVDLIQIGARNMQNFDLLKQLGQIDRQQNKAGQKQIGDQGVGDKQHDDEHRNQDDLDARVELVYDAVSGEILTEGDIFQHSGSPFR